ncbi:MAG: CPBP family intramembrane metalloprotease [Planctomycetes bacterium]|nr:CPBP family intramembrane metalloprotease [Planctomycetota bacterium]
MSFLKGLSLWAAVGAAVVEEAFFRRIVMDGVMQAGDIVPLQIIASALVFGVAHALWGLIKGSVHVALTTAVATGIIGAALAVVYAVGDRSLAPCIAAHFLIDAVVQPGLVLSAVSDEWDRADAVGKNAV